MKAWLATPVTRAEAIGWALTFPVLMTILDAAVRVHVSLELIELAGGPREDLMSPALKVYQDIGQSGFVVLFCACALLPLLALITRQQPWVRVAAPLLCGLLAFSMWSQVRTAISDYQAAEATNVGDERKPSWLDEEPDLTGIDAEADDPRDPLDPDSEAEPASPR